MKSVQHIETLFYCDGPQVFEARDADGERYVAVMIESADGRDRYLIARTEPERLEQFRRGLLDLRSLMMHGSKIGWYIGIAEGGIDEPMPIAQQEGAISESGFLPERGFALHEPTTAEVPDARGR